MTENRGHSGRRARARSAAVRYQAVCSPVQNDPNGTCTYGLECLTDRQGAWVQWDLIEDVSPSRESVLSLAPAATPWACLPSTSGMWSWTASTPDYSFLI